ncbi:MAG: hypothetical protein QME57_02320 [Patescibacteria group bacterium]|nr:hypothetical protein [Patescibacteria group bacterium]
MRVKNKLIFSIIILALLAGVIGYWSWQRNIYSKEVLKLEILGPETVELAKDFEYIVKYKNNGTVRLEEPKLIFEYPKQAIVPENKALWQEITLDDIYPGEEKTIPFKAKLLGKEGEILIAKASLSYRPKNLKARYELVTTFTTQIKSVPLTFEIDLPSKIESEKSFTFRINYFSNLNYPLADLRIQSEYPFDFEFVSSVPKSLEKNEWLIPVLNQSQGGKIEISGRVSGEVGEAKIFRAKLGIFKEGEFILLKETQKGLEIIKPSIYLRQEINGNPQYVALPGNWLHYDIYFKNIGNETLNNLFMVCQLEGEFFDFQTIKSDLGQIEPGLNSIIFDWHRISKLQYLVPMEEGKVDFWIKLKDDLSQVKDPILKNKVSISQVKEEFITKISSKLEIVQKGYFQDEVFGNSGPIPPQVGETTTYTIIWQVKNYYSLVKDVKVKAFLPRGVELTAGKIFPEEEASKFAFDSQSGEIVWSVGDLERGSGIFTPAKSIAFQIAFTPNEFQRDQIPEIISEAKITGEDSWTERIIEVTANSINTTLPDDPSITEEMGRVK